VHRAATVDMSVEVTALCPTSNSMDMDFLFI